MNIVVCVKQVPMSGDAKVDPVTGVMIRSSADTKLNPFETVLQDCRGILIHLFRDKGR